MDSNSTSQPINTEEEKGNLAVVGDGEDVVREEEVRDCVHLVQGVGFRVEHSANSSSSALLFSSLKLIDTRVYEPSIRALLGIAAHFCKGFLFFY